MFYSLNDIISGSTRALILCLPCRCPRAQVLAAEIASQRGLGSGARNTSVADEPSILTDAQPPHELINVTWKVHRASPLFKFDSEAVGANK